jgi:hypothetical protein
MDCRAPRGSATGKQDIHCVQGYFRISRRHPIIEFALQSEVRRSVSHSKLFIAPLSCKTLILVLGELTARGSVQVAVAEWWLTWGARTLTCQSNKASRARPTVFPTVPAVCHLCKPMLVGYSEHGAKRDSTSLLYASSGS